MTAREVLDQLVNSKPVPLTAAPMSSGIYATRDHLGIVRYVGIAKSTAGFRGRWTRHVSGSSERSYVFSHAYNCGRMWSAYKDESEDGKTAKKLRSLFARRYCLGTYVAFPRWRDVKAYCAELGRLEREVQEAAPFDLPWLGKRNFENTVEPRDHVDTVVKELSWSADVVAAISRQAAKCPNV